MNLQFVSAGCRNLYLILATIHYPDIQDVYPCYCMTHEYFPLTESAVYSK